MSSEIMTRALKGEFTLIAEIGVNYYDIAKKEAITAMEAAKLMIKKAQEAGVHAVKFQSYKADTIASKDSPSYWDLNEEPTRSQYELFRKFDQFGKNEYRELNSYCKTLGIEFLSTAFDKEAADYLEPMMEVYKISSSDITNLPFVRYQAQKDKPIILSTGASNKKEIEAALTSIREVNQQPIVLMHCVLEYPTPIEHANLLRIRSLKEQYPKVIIGYSDHTKPDCNADIIKAAYLLGAVMIEKHFTLDKTLKGNDHYHAMDPQDAKNIISEIKKLQIICGEGRLEALESEAPAIRNARRSLVSTSLIRKGTIITEDMLTYKRPASGISPADINEVIGRSAAIDIMEDTVLQKSMINK